MISLSYSTIANCLQPTNSHNWLNKVMCLKPEDKEIYHEGKVAHDLIQKHLSGKQIDPRLNHINYKFPVVEEVDFDARCKFDVNFQKVYQVMGLLVAPCYQPKNEYNLIGFFDGLDEDNGRMLEIKSSSGNGWSTMKFQNLIQRKLYSIGKPTLTETICIACNRDITQWEKDKPKVFIVPFTQQDKIDAFQWILQGISVLEGGDFTGGLTDGVCKSYNCYYGQNCSFR